MAAHSPWSVKGVDQATRAAARAAAARAGLPIGAWLDRAILKAASVDATPCISDPAAESAISATADAEPPSPEPLPPPVAAAAPLSTATSSAPPLLAAPIPIRALRPASSLLDIPAVSSPQESPSASAEPASPPAERVLGFARSRPYRLRRVIGYGTAAAAVIALVATGVMVFTPSTLDKPASRPPQVVASVERPTLAKTAPKAPAKEAPSGSAASAPRAGTPTPDRVVANPDPTAIPETADVTDLAKQAAAGDAAAEHRLGLLYASGKAVAKDDRVAAEWFEKAAAQGLAPAQYNLGVLYERGTGVVRDPKKALFWYRRAADQNYARAEHNLATLYATGSGVPQNYAEAQKWFSRAADGGITESLYSLGLMYEHGLGVGRNVGIARGYYRRAAASGSADARAKLVSLGNDGKEPNAASLAVAARLASAVAPGAGGGSAGAPDADRSLDRRETAELQRLLARLDFAPGSADGVAGRRTVAAIRLYQEFAGLPVDGKATLRLLDDVRDVSKTVRRQPRTAQR